MRKTHNWPQVQVYYNQCLDAADSRKHFGIKPAAWAIAVRRGKLKIVAVERDGRRRYDWNAVQAHYDRGHSVRECMKVFGFYTAAWQKAVRRGDIKSRPNGCPLPELLAHSKSRTNLKQRLLRAGSLQNRCVTCGIAEWLGERLTIQIDHINGDPTDHRLENLRMLCPNCHSQTDTYGRRNRRVRSLARNDPARVV